MLYVTHDIDILCVGNSLDQTSAEASHHVHELLSQGAANSISFDPNKIEVMHFSRMKPKITPPVLYGEVEKWPDRVIRWLGVWPDSTLSFKIYVEKQTARALAIAFYLKRLINTQYRPLLSAIRRAVYINIILVLLYVAEAQYPSPIYLHQTKLTK